MRSIFEYLDHRQFLRDYYEERKSEKSISLRAFSRRAGFGSPNYLKLVMDGHRNLSRASALKFAKALGFSADETAFFIDLVLMNQAETHEEKNKHYQSLSRIGRYVEIKHIEKDQYAYFSKWYYAAIRELTLLPGFVMNYEWIAKALRPSITASQAEEAIALLCRLGLLVKGQDGKLVPSSRNLTTGNEVAFLASCNFHIQMLKRAADYVASSKPETRDFSCFTFAVSPEKFEELKERLVEFKKEVRSLLADCDDPQDIYQLNVQLFPLSEVTNASA